MADNWRILDLSFMRGNLAFDTKKRKLIVTNYETEEETSHVLGDINIIFIGIGVSMAASFPYHLASHDCVAVFCDWKGLPVASLYPWIDAHGRVAARQRAQASMSVPRSKNAWMRIIKSKIRGQANVLEAMKREESDRLRDMAANVKSGDTDNKEAQAARLYWTRLFCDKNFIRSPGIRESGRNGLLDFGYTILRGHSMRAVLSAGLTPALGLYHKGRSNSFALADDLIEPFRPAIDYAVALLPDEADTQDKEIRSYLLKAAIADFGNYAKTIPTIMTEFAQHFGQYAEGEGSYLEVPVFELSKTSKKETSKAEVKDQEETSLKPLSN